jgi:transposase
VSLQAQLSAMAAKLASAEAVVVALRAQLAKNSQNSSKPPSSDLPKIRSPRKKRSKRRKRGGQPGHQARFANEPDHVDHVKQYRASECQHCHADLAEGKLTDTCINHYVYALPDIRPIVTDHQCLDVCCPKCGLVTPATLPPEVPKGSYDPSVQAMTALLRGEMRQSVRQTSSVLTQVMNVPMSTGMVAKTQGLVSEALAAPYAEAHAHAQSYDRPHVDETSWPQNKKKAWLWVMVAGLVTVFRAGVGRGKDAAKDLIGEGFRGVLTTDRWASYRWVATTMRQLCWSHLKRDFKSFLDYGKDAKRIGERLLCEKRKLFRAWHKVRDGTMSRPEFQLAMKPVRRRIVALLDEGRGLSCRKVSGMCKQILKLQEALFTFVDIERVEPTNNAAERALRFAVLMRKGCFGSDSERGSRFVERFLTVRATLRTQKRSLYAFLKEACAAALMGAPAPSLLPISASSTATLRFAA